MRANLVLQKSELRTTGMGKLASITLPANAIIKKEIELSNLKPTSDDSAGDGELHAMEVMEAFGGRAASATGHASRAVVSAGVCQGRFHD